MLCWGHSVPRPVEPEDQNTYSGWPSSSTRHTWVDRQRMDIHRAGPMALGRFTRKPHTQVGFGRPSPRPGIFLQTLGLWLSGRLWFTAPGGGIQLCPLPRPDGNSHSSSFPFLSAVSRGSLVLGFGIPPRRLPARSLRSPECSNSYSCLPPSHYSSGASHATSASGYRLLTHALA